MFLGDPKLVLDGHWSIKWDHPHFGEILETVCGEHAVIVPLCLKFLGIGYQVNEVERIVCIRCLNDGVPAKDWIGQYVS